MAQITKEYLDSLSEDDIIFIRNYIWKRFGRSSKLDQGFLSGDERVSL